MMEKSVVTFKGQIVIPATLRRKVGIKQGTRVFLEEKNGDIIVHPATPEFYDRTFGILKGSGLVRALEESRRKEREHEERKIEGR
ncbi:MAG: hypothetical protein A3G87_05295 [Omnitrophica bacterium RIFCSPLOWO2_12_FULL_50_11]|nr:MAG: hypothetical protein A3G87_05295 [Omnitrophica bacterium RIFCSPLOWO2_12_FULL_50_11]